MTPRINLETTPPPNSKTYSIPQNLLTQLPSQQLPEFKEIRYTPATCDPSDFGKLRGALRLSSIERNTKILIAITLYNEDAELLARTLHGVIKNIADLCKHETAGFGREGWRKIVICVIADGRQKLKQFQY
jgi:chitin synthase